MKILTIILVSAAFLIGGCTLGENLDNRYTKETSVPALIQKGDICITIPIQSDEIVASALTYNMKKPSEQIIFPADKQPKSGLFCIQTGEFRFENGKEYLTYIEVNKKADIENKKATRKAYTSTFRIVQQDNDLKIVPIIKK